MKQTFTLTFGDCAENHRDMQIIGKKINSGLSKDDLLKIQRYFDEKEFTTELIHLNELLNEGDEIKSPEETKKIDDAYILIIKNGLSAFVDADKLYEEQNVLEKDKKAFMYGRVVNKHARHNLCFSDFSQEPDYENKKGTVYNFKDLPLLNQLRTDIGKLLSNDNLQCEGNYYYDTRKTYIGFHGDTERKIVAAVRLGAEFPLFFRWYYQGEPKGELFRYVLTHGDIYIMSDKAVGYDWKSKNKYTLRHAAGFETNLKMD